MTETTSEETGFIEAICANPAEDTVRLVYADWLDEHGEHERAEFVRAQVALAAWRADSAHVSLSPAGTMRHSLLRGRQEASWQGLLPSFGLPANWLVTFDPSHLVDMGGDPFGLIERGFVSAITCTAADWYAHADAICWHPEQTVGCGRCHGDGAVAVTGRARAYQMSAICFECRDGRVPRPCPATAQPITRVALTTFPNAHVPEFNSLRKWVKPLEWGGDVRDSFAAEWPGITFTFPEAM